MSLRSHLVQLKTLLRRAGVDREPMPPVIFSIGSHCMYWNTRPTDPFLTEFLEDHPRQPKQGKGGLPVLLSRGCPFDEAPIQPFTAIIRICPLRERCCWFDPGQPLAEDMAPT